MIDDAKLTILAGGHYHCTPKWDRVKSSDEFDYTFAYYLCVEGSASLATVEGEVEMTAGNIYFIPLHHWLWHRCQKEMWKYWVLWTSQSFYLSHRLLAIRAVQSWPLSAVPGVKAVFERFPEFFANTETRPDQPRKDAPAGLALQIEAMLMYLTGVLIESTEPDFNWSNHAELQRLKPAIDFMDENYLLNPPLIEVARRVNLSDIYFHRCFTREAGMTPFRYMENRRLDLARKLLFDQRLNISEVARQSGYSGLHYFSSVFRRRFGISPSRFRRTP